MTAEKCSSYRLGYFLERNLQSASLLVQILYTDLLIRKTHASILGRSSFEGQN